jgi:hypothetical protein
MGEYIVNELRSGRLIVEYYSNGIILRNSNKLEVYRHKFGAKKKSPESLSRTKAFLLGPGPIILLTAILNILSIIFIESKGSPWGLNIIYEGRYRSIHKFNTHYICERSPQRVAKMI